MRNSSRYLNPLRGSRNPAQNFSRLRRDVKLSEFRGVISAVRGNPHFSRKVFHPPFPTTWLDLKTVRTLEPIGLEGEIVWACEYFRHFGRELTAFAELRASYHQSLLLSDFDAARATIKTIEDAFGLSLWLVKAKMALLQVADGLSAQKEFSASISKEAAPGGVTSYVAYHVSARNEVATLPSRFRSDIASALQNVSPGFAAYLQSHLVPDMNVSINLVAEILRHEGAGAVVDHYEATLQALTQIAASGTLMPTSLNAIDLLIDRVQDERLIRVGGFLLGDASLLRLSAEHSGLASLVRGDYGVAIRKLQSDLQANPDDADSFLALARALTSTEEQVREAGDLINRLAIRLGAWLGGSKDIDNELQRFALNHANSNIAQAITLVVSQDSSIGHGSSALSHLPLFSNSASPLWLQLIKPGPFRERFGRLSALLNPELPVLELIRVIQQGNGGEGLDRDERNLALSQERIEAGDFPRSLSAAKELASSRKAFHRRKAAQLESLSLLRAGHQPEAIRAIVSHYLQNAAWVDSLPIAAAVQAIKGSKKKEVRGAPAWAILLDIHTHFIDHTADSDVMFAVSHFLDAHGLAKPSQIESIAAEFDAQQLIYFLRYLCTESVFDKSGRFGSSLEVLDERMAVCRLLLSLDPDNPEPYHTEIKEIARRQMLRRRMRQVEQSKIHVDTESVRRTLRTEMPDLYARYEALKRSRVRPLLDATLVGEIVKHIHEMNLGELVSLRIPKDETSEVFQTLITRVRDEYVFSSDHGLNKYLSVRIRHGTLTAALRKPLESAHLVTLRGSSSKVYKRNDFWMDRLKTSSTIETDLSVRLGRFSASVDEMLDEVKGWLNVSADGTGDGLFKFVLHPTTLDVLEQELRPGDPSFEAFLDRSLEFFGAVLDRNLEAVRDALLNRARPRCTSLLDQLEHDVDRLDHAGDLSDLSAAIRTARTDLQFAFTRVTDWFRRSSSIVSEPFSLEDALDTGIECAKQLAPTFVADVRCGADPEHDIEGSQLTPLVDVFFIVFENIVRHSGVAEPSAEVDVVLEKGVLAVRVENPVAPDALSEEAQARVDRIRAEIKDEQNALAVTREGGTGFHKLNKVLGHEFGVVSDVAFDFVDGSRFVVKFSTPLVMVPK